MLKAGDVVKVYEDPITEEKLEGEATLVKFIEDVGGVFVGRTWQRWEVVFTERPEEGKFTRQILSHVTPIVLVKIKNGRIESVVSNGGKVLVLKADYDVMEDVEGYDLDPVGEPCCAGEVTVEVAIKEVDYFANLVW